MSLLRNVIRSNGLFHFKPNQSLPFLLRESAKHFSTGTEDQKQQLQDSAIDPFLNPPNRGLIYGKLKGIGKHTSKTDVINLLEGCDLTLKDVKVEYNRLYDPLSMIVQFHSRSAFDNANRAINRKGRLYKLEKVDHSFWDIMSYEGKVVLLLGIPRNASIENIEHLLSGCDFDASNIQLFSRSIRVGLVQFPSQTEAMNAVLRKNRSFCLNNQILMRVLH